jgi:hypothetical protein
MIPMSGNMTHNDLLTALQRMSAEELAQNVTIYVPSMDEFFPVRGLLRAGEIHEAGDSDPAHGVLDDNHAYLEMRG